MSGWKNLALAAAVAAGIVLSNEEEIKESYAKAKAWVKKKLQKKEEKEEENRKKSPQNAEVSTPDQFLCPLTGQIMQDPVVTPQGICFERAEIEKYLKIQDVCPMTGQPLTAAELRPSLTTRAAIRKFKEDCMNTI